MEKLAKDIRCGDRISGDRMENALVVATTGAAWNLVEIAVKIDTIEYRIYSPDEVIYVAN